MLITHAVTIFTIVKVTFRVTNSGYCSFCKHFLFLSSYMPAEMVPFFISPDIAGYVCLSNVSCGKDQVSFALLDD